MKREKGTGLPWWLGIGITLPILTLILLKVIVLSIRTGKAETRLFVDFYFLIVLSEIILRSFFRGKGAPVRPWYYWGSWICRWALIVMTALSIGHMKLGGTWDTLLAPDVYNSSLWVDRAIVPLRWFFSISGLAVILGRKETRKKALIISGIAFPAMFLLIGIVSMSEVLKNSPALSNLLGNTFLFVIPHLHGLAGAIFYPLYGKKIRAEKVEKEKKRLRQEAASQAAVQRSSAPAQTAAPVTGAGLPVPPSAAQKPAPAAPKPRPVPVKPKTTVVKPVAPRNIEKELTDQKAAYEARMHSLEAAKKKTLEQMSVDSMLEKTAERLFSEGQAAASLGGQRQLIYWMAKAVPRLGGLIRQPVGKQFFSPSLRDDPDVFLPILDALLSEAARLLESRNASKGNGDLDSADPESLCAGWYALTRFAAVSANGAVFSKEADRIKAHFKKDKPCSAWLKSALESMEERDPK